MNISRIVILTICLLCLVGATVPGSEAATTFNRSTIVAIDQAQQTVTFHTREGQTWTLPLADPNILKKEQFSKGNQVSIEIDLSDRITKIIKPSEESRSDQAPYREDLRP
jgi:hypothetical protein